MWVVVSVLLAGAGLGGLVVWQNSYALREEQVSLRHDGAVLKGVLARPERGDGPFGLVVFVHGDGPVDATHDTFYRPLWESFARAGYASLSFSKRGVGGSQGDWLEQSMADRAQETLAAIAWARQRPDIDGRRIGLWGASQAGWVLPKVAAADRRLQFVIAVSPAVNWLRQGRYNLLAELRRDHASERETRAALRRREVTLRLLERGASFDEYRAEVGDADGMTPQRWRFIARNHRADATADLRAMRGTPVLLVLAGHDVNVDVAETEAVYRDVLPRASLRVAHYPGATHSLVEHGLERSRWRLTLTAVFAPRKVYIAGFLADQARYVRQVNNGSGTPARPSARGGPGPEQGRDPRRGAVRVQEEVLEGDGVLAGRLDGDSGGLQVHHTGGRGDGHVGAFQPAAPAQCVDQRRGLGPGAVVDGLLQQFGPVAGDGRDGYAVVVRGGVVRAGRLGDLEDPGNVDVQVHQAACAPPRARCPSSASSKTAWCSARKRVTACTARARRPLASSSTSRARYSPTLRPRSEARFFASSATSRSTRAPSCVFAIPGW
ncbi:hypothetical protein GCM10018783_03420 [Streptomyces griseosporeus]|nr:hypothetical protein GCM10018783_03420 [Streptomyces griseosporeus]